MTVAENIPLARYTTFHIGGPARLFVTCETEDDVISALALSRECGLPLLPLGEGSNLLAGDEGIEAVVVHIRIPGISFEEKEDGVEVSAGAGVSWDALVGASAARGLWGIENLAGIPGTVGAAPVQNIGAYGTELEESVSWAETIRLSDGAKERFPREQCGFSYRTSRFKREREWVITRVAFLLSKNPAPRLSYPDLVAAKDSGIALRTPEEIGRAVRSIRAAKFPDLSANGTAGSFFKNPLMSQARAEELMQKFPGLPIYPAQTGVKVPLAWILDQVLGLRGYRKGKARLFERQPLVIVADPDASAHDVEILALEVAERVLDATGIIIEREVETFGK